MTPERWEEVEKLLEAALLLPPEQRATFVAGCQDKQLGAELERLLSEHEHLSTFLNLSTTRPLPSVLEVSTSDLLGAGEVLNGRYRIVRLLGKGGMGEVYEAEDAELNHCRIALKTLRAGLPSEGQPIERFKREIMLGRRINHPNVCPIYHLDRADRGRKGETLFLTMEFLSGETLAQRLKRTGPMDAPTAARIAEDIIAGLAACHRLGIVHRDFKCGNVMLAEDAAGKTTAVVTDFGLAHTVDAGSRELTGDCIMGTPEYMAPEQWEGKPAMQSSDIYALGVVLCEMLTGKRPVPSGPRAAVGLPAGGPRVDRVWEGVILRCVESDPAKRFGSAEEVAAALRLQPAASGAAKVRSRWLLPAAALLLALVVLSAWFFYRRDALPKMKHVAVLPFRTIGATATDQVFCDGLVETLASKLSQLERYQKSFWVVPASEARKVTDPAEAYRKLNATLVVNGSLERLPAKTVLFIHVIDARSGRQVAARDITIEGADLTGMEEAAWERVTDMLDVELGPAERRSVEEGNPRVPEAAVAYVQGLGYLRRGGLNNVNNAIAQFQQAITRDPSYALPYSGLGSAYALKYEMTKDPQWLDRAADSAHSAVRLAPDLAPVHFTLGQISCSRGQYEEAEHELKRALELDPAIIEAQYYLGRLYEREGKLAEAERNFRAAVDRRPDYWHGRSDLGKFYYDQGRLVDAEGEFLEAVSLQPDNARGLSNLGAVYMAEGRFADALRVLRSEVRLEPDNADAYSNLGACFLYLRQYDNAVAPMKKAAELKPDDQDFQRNLGDAYHFAGQAEKSTAAYSRALEFARWQLDVNPKDWETMASAALYEAHLDHRAEALRLVERSMKMAPSNNEIFFTAALIYEILGQRAAALQALRSAQDKGHSLADIERTPDLDALRKDNRYQDWIEKVKAGLKQSREPG